MPFVDFMVHSHSDASLMPLIVDHSLLRKTDKKMEVSIQLLQLDTLLTINYLLTNNY